NGTTLSYTVDGVTAGVWTGNLSQAFLGGSPFAYFGFTGATGGGSAQQQVRILALDATAENGTILHADRNGAANTPPTVAATGSFTINEDTASTAIAIGASDADGDLLSYSLKTGFTPAKGAVAFSNGNFTYTPTANANGADSFTITVSDGHGGTAEKAISVNITPVNDAPTAAATKSITASAGTATQPVAIGASDVDGDSLSYALKTGFTPAKGAVAFSNGSFTYTANGNANGADSFTILVSDGHGGTAEQVVSVGINPSTVLNLGVGLDPNGSTTHNTSQDIYVLTPNTGNQAGSVMSETRIDLRSAFSISFEINVGANDAGADGMAFVLHNSPLGAQALGTAGGGTGLGALGIQNGVGIEFDIFYSFWTYPEPSTDHTNIFDTDRTTTNPEVTTPFSLGNIEDGQWHDVDVIWNGTTLSYTVDGVTAGVWTGNLSQAFLGGSPFAYFGFTAATGGGSAQQQVRILALDATAENGTILHADRNGVANIAQTFAAPDSVTLNATTLATSTPDSSDHRMAGGADHHTLSAGWGNDTFIFNPGFGNDASAHFGDTGGVRDIFHVATSAFADFAAVQQATAQVGHDIVIAATAFDNLTVKNKTVATHGPNDFHLI
uniref:lectin-like domain-containing protein n=1 Tax=Hyphomicrobium sp. TaxID=82 RepID=UPI003F6EB079